MGTAANGRQALRRVTALEPDLVFMDVRLPGMSGLKATRRIKARNDGSVAIIIMTADDHPGCRAAAKAAGADGFVGKTASMFTALQSTIRRLFPCAQLWLKAKANFPGLPRSPAGDPTRAAQRRPAAE